MPTSRRSYKRRGAKRTGRKLNKRQIVQVKRLVRNTQELKFYDLLFGGGTFLAPIAGIVYFCNPIPQGTTDTNRIGDTISLKRLQFRFNFDSQADVAIVRIIVFQWVPLDPPIISDVLVLGAGGTVNHTSPYRNDTKGLYRILSDKTWVMNGSSTTSNVTQTTFRSIGFSVYPKRKKTQYEDVATSHAASGVYILSIGTGTSTNAGVIRNYFTDS